jgi:hypothetical protein
MPVSPFEQPGRGHSYNLSLSVERFHCLPTIPCTVVLLHQILLPRLGQLRNTSGQQQVLLSDASGVLLYA